MIESSHETYMQMAIEEARTAFEAGEVPAGCVIVRRSGNEDFTSETVIGRGYNQVEQLKDPTAHAEMIAITQAAETTGDWRLTGTTLYVTKEPCAMCAGAVILARIQTVVFGTPDPKRGGAVSTLNILQNPNLNHSCEVIPGVLEEDCREMLKEFFRLCRERNNTG